ncbi:hypothetical protein NE237_017873 [Protea cynaroides]|uniref:Uncharacterized protein n=1 Tax=Protea cynaroides TaxID=273540 RepID=A0A9Q0K8W2_9MAGN|nr:hypothetical protein NE237_017873 [Protea cynaroides]
MPSKRLVEQARSFHLSQVTTSSSTISAPVSPPILANFFESSTAIDVRQGFVDSNADLPLCPSREPSSSYPSLSPCSHHSSMDADALSKVPLPSNDPYLTSTTLEKLLHTLHGQSLSMMP